MGFNFKNVLPIFIYMSSNGYNILNIRCHVIVVNDFHYGSINELSNKQNTENFSREIAGVINFTSLSLNWVGLSLSETSLSQSALVSLFGLLSENSLNFKTLTQLDLSRNVLKKDATTVRISFLYI